MCKCDWKAVRGTKRFNPVEKLCRTRMARPRAVGGYAVVVAIETLSAFSKTKKGWLRSVAA